ncbi:MAG: type IV secretory system conjugative DNA transfer family protein, partial [candidate division Zixibacteria bacterium]|nr:type IV secretory system conjugative DNA transfer family protein [candidate division Zixibacteria bacterium]
LHQVAMSRQEQSEAERKVFYLHVDEFHNFITPSMASMLSGARKFGLGLVLAHQELRQLLNRDSDVAGAVISNPYTRICFRLGDSDARKLADGFSHFDAKDLQNLGVGQAIVRIERAEFDFNLKTLPLPPVQVAVAKTRRERLFELSRQTYASQRQNVEAEMEKQRGMFSSVSDTPAAKPKAVAPNIKLPPSIPLTVPVSNGAAELKPVKDTGETPLLGRGGQQHKYLQHLFKRLAEEKGFLATIEKPVLDGAGFIDLALEKDGQNIACEFCVTSPVEQELGNVQKCLRAGFETVIVISAESPMLGKISKLVAASLEQAALSKVSFMLPEDFPGYLENLGAQSLGEETTVRGRKVKLNYKPVGETEKKTRREAVAAILSQAWRRLRRKGSEKV